MKTIGMLGGMSWESTSSYYRAINQGVMAALGGLHSAKIYLYSVDFADIERLQNEANWDEMALILSKAAKSIELAGADFLILCTNTMHKVVPKIETKISIPLVHIADATGNRLVTDVVSKVGLLGTRFTMEQDFYKRRLVNNFGIEVMVPDVEDQTIIHDIIYDELCRGVVSSKSREKYLTIIDSLSACGAEAVILGCTEIALLIQQQHTQIKLYDTTKIHADYAVQLAISAKTYR